MSKQKVAVIGASGVVGRALMERFRDEDVEAVALSRRPPADLEGIEFHSLDLLNRDACKQCASSLLAGTTHLVYAALYEKPGLIAGWRDQDQMQTNLTMLRNLLDPLKRSSNLSHVTLLQGTKAYGAHVEPMKIPGIESEPRHPHENFYWLQEDALTDYGKETGWTQTIWRPQVIFGHALHAPMNMLAAVGTYAALQKEAGLPFTYPGGPSAISEAIDADLLAAAIHFSFDQQAFRNQTFNITNGDAFRWQDSWSALADVFDMEIGEPKRQFLSESFYEREEDWRQIVKKHNLKPYALREVVGDSYYYADAMFNAYGTSTPPPALLSTIKLRQAGFHECIDTTAMFRKWFAKLGQLEVLPVFRH